MKGGTRQLLLFLAGYSVGFVSFVLFSDVTRVHVGKNVSPIVVQSKTDTVMANNIPYTLRGDSLKSKSRTCNCTDGNTLKVNFQAIDPEELKEVKDRRKAELQKFKRRKESSKETLLIVNGSVPLSYPAQGVVVAPHEPVYIPGLKVADDTVRDDYKVQLLSAEFGVLDIGATVPNVDVNGLGTTSLTMSSTSLAHLNRQLEFVVYVSTVFDIDAREYVHFVYMQHEAIIPIIIRVRKPPILYDTGKAGEIHDKVTAVTKTFLRYGSVRLLLRSIQKYYPRMRVVVADDSKPIEDLQSEHVDHYVMPFASGWFGGRNLAVSQVTTPYLLWLDDDFVFTEDTKLEIMAGVLDNSNLDVVSGIAGEKNLVTTRMELIPGTDDDDGYCIYHKSGNYGQVPGFPDCYLTTKVFNFFMGRSDEIRSVGFYPAYSRYADREFYLEALGKLRMAACKGIHIGHNQTRNREYKKYRYGRDQEENYKKYIMRVNYFRSNADCWHR
ncbi:beta-1,4 N-acetylgalactosaminyltransferase 1-like isoform X1 [Branchiostoma floridae]|uniref:Beta-1,4 N-acetylgalactosaminyltransferase 1-like isoform X1 n=1 Tax=Branchiostoma floridae TaxID=7739 RepID=A0A9J7L0V0_BRAFL|nr:beta-1,4 N-acetylgalactosaminyltransferase 1-like isoform X1 [Branchiostoma floridae]